jgi:aldehyde:ferredoxin oxidoreductase
MTQVQDVSVPDEIKGYTQVRLDVDLTTGKITETELTPEFCRDWIGGYGYGAKVMWDELKGGEDALGPENIFIWNIGPFPGTILPTSSKYGVFAKSPLTGMFGMSISSGSIGAQARRAGVNMIVFYGKSPEPVYMVVDDDLRYLVPCKDTVWGKDAWETEDIIKEEFGDPRLAVMAIGQAGERLNRMACITNDRNRQAGRSGMGAVMGSKNLKAICFRGTKGITVAQPKKFYKHCKKLIEMSNDSPTAKYRDLGTPAGMSQYHTLGMFPVRNHNEGTIDDFEIFNGETMRDTVVVKKAGCSQCPVACDHMCSVPKDHEIYKEYGETTASVDVETIYSFGTTCGTFDFPTVIKCIALADSLGIDGISGGVTAGMACECYEKGIITKEDLGYELPFGSTLNLVKFVTEMCLKEGFAGKVFGDGSRLAAQRLKEMGRSDNADLYAIHIKGMELPAFDLHGMTSFAVGISVSIRGACHLRNGSYGLDAKGTFDRFGYDKGVERGKKIIATEDLYGVVDSFIICKFTRGIYKDDAEMALVYEEVTGIPMTDKYLIKRGEAIVNLSKCYNIREGWTRADDHPPRKFFEVAHTRGPNKGVLLQEEGFQKLLSGYYEARGWDIETGIPTEAKLKELDLDFVIPTILKK